MRRFIARALVPVLAAVVIAALPLHAQRVQEEMLVSPDWVQRRLGIVTILHVGDGPSYAARHLPGAVLLETSSLLVSDDGTPNELPSADVLERVFRTAGVDAAGRIVVYGTDPVAAARAWFTLHYLGQGSRTSLLDGGLAGWMAAGYTTTTEAVRPRRGSFQARPDAKALAHLGAMRELVHLHDWLGEDLVLLDARPQEQYCGDEAGPGVARPGHIPGAVNVPYSWNLDVTGALRPAADLRAIYRRAGVNTTSANIVYCRTGMQASLTFFVLRYLGYDAILYDGSYVEWSNAGGRISS